MQSTAASTRPESPLVSDRQLIEAARNGDQRGYEQLVRRYKDRLFRSMLGSVPCRTHAEEIVQEAFVRAFHYLDSFQNRSNFYTWLYRIALNSRRTYLSKHQGTLQLESVGEQASQIWTKAQDSPAGRAERLEERSQVREALQRLGDQQRTILMLREFDGLEYRQIAEIMDLNMGTVRSRLARARARLKQELTPYVDSKPNRTTRRHTTVRQNANQTRRRSGASL